MQGFQNLSHWAKRNPFTENVARPSIDALYRLADREGVSPDATPFGEDEMEFAFWQQAQEAQERQRQFTKSSRWDPMRGGIQTSPSLERAMGDAISGGWKGFSESMDRSQRMAHNRGFNSRIDLAGRGPGTGTGIGRYMAQFGQGNAAGSFTPTMGPAFDLESLQGDARNTALRPQDRTMAIKALQMVGGR